MLRSVVAVVVVDWHLLTLMLVLVKIVEVEIINRGQGYVVDDPQSVDTVDDDYALVTTAGADDYRFFIEGRGW